MALNPEGEPPTSAFNRQSNVILRGLQSLVDNNVIFPHQAEAVIALRNELENPPQLPNQPVALRNVSLAVLPTGTGKTGVGVLAAYACNARSVLVITPSETISKQQITQFTYVFDERVNPLRNLPFLHQRGVFTGSTEGWTEEMKLWAPANSTCVLNTRQIRGALGCELVVANAHKFGERTNAVDLGQIDPRIFELVIVDEAHHYPAHTWSRIIQHFSNRRIIFLTATPFHKGQYILRDKLPCYELRRQDAITGGYIRPLQFDEVGIVGDKNPAMRPQEIFQVLQRMQQVLQHHDGQDPRFRHKGMVLADDTDEANTIVHLWNERIQPDTCARFTQGDPLRVVDDFTNSEGRISVVVVIRRLTEGFDCKNVSVVAILRNVQKKSRVCFAQFVGRAVRKLAPDDPVEATVISHAVHNQKENFEMFENLAEEDPDDL